MVEVGFTFVLLLTTCIEYREVAVASFRKFINDHHHHHLTHMYRGGGMLLLHLFTAKQPSTA